VGTDDGLPRIRFASPAEWEEWLEDNHAVSQGVWIKMAKKDSGIESVRYPEVLEIALCFGWSGRSLGSGLRGPEEQHRA
jgi:uncharacterized protein YdeI (YjbR/CyaY-like superfamily)